MKTNLDLSGAYEDLPNDVYHAGPGYSSTDIIDMGESFAYWKWRKANRKVTGAMLLGSATHLLLEARIKDDASLLEGMIITTPLGDRTKGFEKLVAENPGKYVLNEDDWQLAHRMIDAVFSDAEVSALFSGGISEPSVFGFYPGTEVLVKCRPDYLRPDDGLSVNFKTCEDASEKGFVKACGDRAYDWQSAFYLDILQAHYKRNFDEVHVCVEKNEEGPIRIGVWTIDDEDLDFARSQFRQIIERIPECERTEIWPNAPTGIQTVKLPAWARRIVNL